MPHSIAIIGTGPTGIYSFRKLIEHQQPLSVWLFERGVKAGIGMPYSPETASKSMLANIASIEIPEVVTTYLDWLQEQPATRLRDYGLDPEDLDARQFTPRLLLGEYFRDQLMELVRRARNAGHEVEIRESTEVTDLRAVEDGIVLDTSDGPVAVSFDRVILATGHDFPDEDEATKTWFPSPWSGLIEAKIPVGRVGIMGTSLSSIDAAMAVANQHGRFSRRSGELTFTPQSEGLTIALMSWTGILPEADFYCPIPYEPLSAMTDAALDDLRTKGVTLDGIFALFAAEIASADPAWAARIALHDLDADSFATAYFADREASDPFRWARENLEEAERNKASQITVPWRYAILRMHEQVEDLFPELSDTDRERFEAGLKKVFVDNYAAVPSESIRRLLALREAKVLKILALGEDYDMKRMGPKTRIQTKGATYTFDTFIDARGQKPLASKDLPFPGLRDALLDAGQAIPEVDEAYALQDCPDFAGRVWFGSIPWLMHDRPFVQGITASADIGTTMARDLQRDVEQAVRPRRRRRRMALS
ncbi:FAD-NAD(P)-binding protein [Paenirhodobacter populi]|uniref:FAD-NAD(P)-binding protein n=1 Tax=Paenirhodobacter populi TaxID=2306993 RepID=A0A443JRC8_9RHOB|nr:FAD-NAD(P)-binding protein [Sinirhodobacter populi]RWR23056.1 FAD-NAD(P)-binding protein [Sinirhodobacter populi]